MQVQQSGTAFVEIDDFLQENEKFNGTDNALIYSRTYKMTLLCNFLLEKFPFDTQICYIVVSTIDYFIDHIRSLMFALRDSLASSKSITNYEIEVKPTIFTFLLFFTDELTFRADWECHT